MMNDPLLRKKTGLPDKGVLYVNGGLNYLKGNKSPYFSLTATLYEGGRDVMGGCCHDLILEHFPELSDMAALHLSDIDGAPMHAIANGWYKLAGYFPDAFGERYHAGNSPRNFDCPAPADKPWKNYEHRLPTSDECLGFFAAHCRIDLTEARTIAEAVGVHAMAQRHSRNAEAQAKLTEFMEAMRPRWKVEADACILKHGLTVYGDKWEG